jgi:hypothetical protein
VELTERLEDVARVTLRPIASPMPIGFVGLAAATLPLAALQLGWIPQAEARTIAIGLLALVFPLQLLASIFGTLARDGVTGTAMAILAGTWAAVGLMLLTSPPGSTSEGLGTILLVSAVAMLWPALGAWLGKLVPALVLTTAALRLATAGIYELSGDGTWEAITGWVGVVLGALALYAALASLMEGVSKKTVLPMGRRRRGRLAVEGGFTEQVVDLTHEPGVREQL